MSCHHKQSRRVPSAGLWKNRIIFSELLFIKATLRNDCGSFADGEKLKKKM